MLTMLSLGLKNTQIIGKGKNQLPDCTQQEQLTITLFTGVDVIASQIVSVV
jgi:hypothetical protein